MDAIIYIIIFLIGIVFGSFYTLAVYRIPKGQDITHTRSYCPKCNHRLSFLDLIPVFSYVFLGGKCRYCKDKIRPRYFIIELISGISFVLIAYLMDLSIENITIIKIIDFAFIALYLTFVIIMAGIDKENRDKTKPIIMYGVIISIIYIVYLCIIDQTSIYRYGIYLLFYLIVLVLDTIALKKKAEDRYTYNILLTIITMAIFTGEYVTILAIITTLLAIVIYELLKKTKNKKKNIKKKKKKNNIIKKKKNKKIKKIKNKKNNVENKAVAENISIGFYLAIPNIIFFIFVLAYYRYLV